ncbi:MAG: hypothetical protein H6817_06230 [Phycisphaerales bacterium]|nr:hypothetical protein [Phycisphaerales bacterium]
MAPLLKSSGTWQVTSESGRFEMVLALWAGRRVQFARTSIPGASARRFPGKSSSTKVSRFDVTTG